MVVFGQGGCTRVEEVVLGQKLLCSGKSGCIRAKVIVVMSNDVMKDLRG